MKNLTYMKAATLALANAGLLLPTSTVLAASPAGVAPTQNKVVTPVIQDVALADGGTLRGQVTDAQGAPLAKSAVSVWSAQSQVASTRTDANGNFAVAHLRGGNYTIVAGEGGGVYRLWAANSAPPQATPGVLIVSGKSTQCAQMGGGGWINPTTVGLGLMGGIVAGGVGSQQNGSDELGSGS